MKTYDVTISFAGFIGCEQTYTVDASSREEAEELALEEATSDLQISGVELIADEIED